MTKLETIICQVAAGVREEMEQSIMRGAYGMHFEQVYGDAYVDIDIFEEERGYYVDVIEQVMVSHFDTAHRSPRLEQAIREVIPDWWEVKTFMMGEERQSA